MQFKTGAMAAIAEIVARINRRDPTPRRRHGSKPLTARVGKLSASVEDVRMFASTSSETPRSTPTSGVGTPIDDGR